MDEQRQKPSGHRRRRNRPRPSNSEPILIAARRPDSPLISRNRQRGVAASAQPHAEHSQSAPAPAQPADALGLAARSNGQVLAKDGRSGAPAHRAARIIQSAPTQLDDRERMRLRLLERLALTEGRHAISKVANELWANELSVPNEQHLQVQLLEHFDEARARDAIAALTELLKKEPPIKRPVLDQRLRRLEENAEEPLTRKVAEALRRMIRS